MKHTCTLKDISDLIFNFQRHAEVWSNPDSIKIASDCVKSLEAFYNWQIQHGTPINAEFTATETYII